MSEKLRADVDKKFIRRFLIISLGCFAFMLWGLYDGLYTSPMDLERSIAYKKLTAQAANGELTEGQRSEKWEAMCNENGWATAKPKSPDVARNYVYFQWFVFGIGLTLGLLFLWHYLRLLNAWVQADEKGVESSWGQTLEYANIKSINKSKWSKKGIAKVSYQDDSGASKIMIFDDFKFHRETMGEIVKLAERGLTDDQIIGGMRESAKAAAAVEATEDASGEES